VPLSKIQSEILAILAAGRDPENYVAGATPLNRDAARFSSDIEKSKSRRRQSETAKLCAPRVTT
jgi:hypothetical protein